MAILKYIYLVFGIIWFITLNILSYTMPAFDGPLLTKLFYSIISFLLLLFVYLSILKTELIFRKPFQYLSTYMKISLYVGIFVLPLISLYYT
ncbi:MAG: hypothetical protein CVV61_03900 [Tenericutes bacterium HGW-Tenericutes-6]|nr:MAG: hypothetical protein CVV61_03900 [Tenericutes bacterium HGW-Tenericutes-6]